MFEYIYHNRHKFLLLVLFAALFSLFPDISWAAAKQSICTSGCDEGTIFAMISCRAACFLKQSKTVVFILAGFGLIGFAFMAIFNKISWKWFSNIAIGLFLVAVMGLFIDYFTTKDGKGTVSARLDFGYDMGSKTDPEKLPPPRDTTCKENPDLPECDTDKCTDPSTEFDLVSGKCVPVEN